jgi:uncharacterized protein (DUF2141 family)
MKNLILTFALVLTSVFSFAQEDKGITITVTIDNVKNDMGKVMLALHTSETFMKGKGIKDVETKIQDGKITATFENVLPGDYAIMALHDENENQKMDFNKENGMPIESYGTSNNPMAFGPPQYDDAKFKAEGKDLELSIRF